MQRLKLVPDMLVQRIEDLEKEVNRLKLQNQEKISKIKNLDKLKNESAEDFVKLSDVLEILDSEN